MHDELYDQQELYEHFRIEADKGQSQLRIDKYLYNRLEHISRNKIQQAAKAGNILVNGTAVKVSYKVRPRDVITVVLPNPPKEFEIIPEDIPINIVYEDDTIIVVNKEPDMVVHPGHGNYTGTLVNALAFHLKDLPLYQSGDIRPGLVHRIDKGTSGIMVVAKTDIALNRLARQFFEHITKRIYVALVWGDLEKDEGTVTGYIGRSMADRLKMQVYPNDEHGKNAVTHYRVIERFGYVTLVECRLETGRTHQIRVHMQHIRHPLFNDDKYGGNKIVKGTSFSKYKQFIDNCFSILSRPALHAKSLGFNHPETGKPMFFDSELPADMSAILDKWRRYISNRGENVPPAET